MMVATTEGKVRQEFGEGRLFGGGHGRAPEAEWGGQASP